MCRYPYLSALETMSYVSGHSASRLPWNQHLVISVARQDKTHPIPTAGILAPVLRMQLWTRDMYAQYGGSKGSE
jgi:hypothetical protein